MIWNFVKAAGLVPLALAVGSCATPTPESCQTNFTATGAAVGAIGGAAIGSVIAAASQASGGAFAAAAIGGALIGGIIGAVAGAQQDKACREMALQQALNQAAAMTPPPPPAQMTQTSASAPMRASAPATAPAYQSVAWANQQTRNSGTITPLGEAPPDTGSANQVCMSFADQQVVNGESKTVTGKACKGPDGVWKQTT